MISSPRRTRGRLSAGATVLCVLFLGGCTLTPSSSDIVYPTDIPTADTTPRPRPTASALPVDPAIGEFCAAFALPIIAVQSAVDDVGQGKGTARTVLDRVSVGQGVLDRYARSGNAEIAGWVPQGTSYFQQLSAAATSGNPAGELSYVVGSVGDPVLQSLVMICAGQPGWE